MTPQKYQYIESDSIIYGLSDEYQLNHEEYYVLYSFFVTYSLGDKQSKKGRKLSDYGWTGNYSRNGLKKALRNSIDIFNNSYYSFADDDNSGADDFFKNECKRLNLDKNTNSIIDFSTERAAISITSGTNNYLRLFYRIRDGFAHGQFVLKTSDNNRMIIIQDQNRSNVTARMILNLDNLVEIIRIIDKNNILNSNLLNKRV